MVGVGLTSHRDSVTNLNGERITYEYNTGEPGQVVTWSGTGPTLEGRLKPDVVAPGHNIISAFNSNCNLENLSTKKKGQLVEHETIGDRDYYWKAESGTSMAAPVVTGTIALWLQANPQLTPDDVKQILAHTARHPEADETYPNYCYGYGEIDAYKGLLYITELTGIEGLSDHQPQHLTFRLTGRTLTLIPRTSHLAPRTSNLAPLTITVYTIGGQPILRAQPTDGTVDLSSLRPGIYAVQVDSGEAATTGSTLIRLQ
jgi:subtilisin family serine protease